MRLAFSFSLHRTMDDNLDRANDELEMSLAQALRQRKPEGPMPTGRCLWCDDITNDFVRWCNADCRDQWESANKRFGR